MKNNFCDFQLNNKCYFVSTVDLNWNDANNWCKNRNLSFLVIENQIEFDYLNITLQKYINSSQNLALIMNFWV